MADKYFEHTVSQGVGDGSVGNPWSYEDLSGNAVQQSTGENIIINGTSTTRKLEFDGLVGTAGNRFVFRAQTEGSVLIDGGGTFVPVDFTAGVTSAYVDIIGINAGNSSGSVYNLASSTACDNIRHYRCGGFDASVADNVHVFNNNSDTNLLYEDCFAFGTGRYMFIPFKGSGHTFRRCWGKYMGTDNTSPKAVFAGCYDTLNALHENCIATIDSTLGADESQRYGMFSFVRDQPASADTNCGFLGCIGYFPNGALWGTNNVSLFTQGIKGTYYDNVAIFVGSDHTGHMALRVDSGVAERTVDNVTLISPLANDLHASASYSNLDEGTTLGGVSSIYTSSTGAQIRYRYQDGVLTSNPLFPWPMNQRIIDLMTTAGYTTGTGEPNDVNQDIIDYFGQYPAEVTVPTGNRAIYRRRRW